MTKEEILSEIRRTAVENDGVALGKQRFFAETGIREANWAGRWWARWSDAVREAGLKPQVMNKSLSDDLVLDAALRIVRNLGRFPTTAEIRLACSNDATLPSHNTFRRFGGMGGLRERLASYCLTNGVSDVLPMLTTEAEGLPRSQRDRDQATSELEEGFVYLLKSGRHYKIGKALSVDHRKRQLDIQLPERAEIVHRIKTDESVWDRDVLASSLFSKAAQRRMVFVNGRRCEDISPPSFHVATQRHWPLLATPASQ